MMAVGDRMSSVKPILWLALLGFCCTATVAEARFVQADPVGYQDDMNPYTYVQDDPANATDPTGKWECTNCGKEGRKVVNGAQERLKKELPGKMAVLKSLRMKLANGGKLTAAEQQAAALMDKYLGAGAGESGGVVDHLMQYAGGILGAVNSNRPANLADGDWPLRGDYRYSEYQPAGDRVVLNKSFFDQPPDEIVQTIAHESARKVGDQINGGAQTMNVNSFIIGSRDYPTQGRNHVADLAATRALSPDDMLDKVADASVSALGY